ncbi:GNAT family N-acetyltransferase [Clostridium sardiniense]|uniref:GNAT family N-acetyltransferase n=1 Tax=Clostridium sardiniense TaxID=29369 RepID=A0ABS7L0A8_CLOSR|nr:GNAT family protein [Clostridium sardiniense]MBY0756495.1 GNAT family N-acetyltransferase [Clostridium sardiniense]MDQ0460238.1 RimJ/RimL family protein N-acetyltransferase [Clostridium sardiniense]
MKYIIKESENIILRKTKVEDLEFVINAEQQKENAQYIGQWTKDQHINSLVNKDILHIIIEESATQKPIGYLIISGIENKNNSIEFRRFVICEKGKGFGKETLKLVKSLAFNDLKANRVWLDVRVKNIRAQNIYKSEGFKEDGVLRECIFYNNKYESLIVMSILKNEY